MFRMIFPANNSISGLGASIFTDFDLQNGIRLVIPANYLISFVLLLLYIFKKIKLSKIFSMFSILLFITAVFKFHEQGILWGFWVAFILNMIDLVLVNLILYKTNQK